MTDARKASWVRTRTMLGIALSVSLAACSQPAKEESVSRPEPTVEGTSTSISASTTTTTEPTPTTAAPTPPPPTEPSVSEASPSNSGGDFAELVARAAAAGVPLAASAIVVASSCYGDQGRPHWGYYNNGALGGAIQEHDGAVVPLDAICLNPNQPSPYSSLLHEMGHRYFWQRGVWNTIGSQMGGFEHATECFARYYGATVYGQGGCSDADADQLAAILGL